MLFFTRQIDEALGRVVPVAFSSLYGVATMEGGVMPFLIVREHPAFFLPGKFVGSTATRGIYGLIELC